MEKYPIMYRETVAGNAQVEKEGLYYSIICQCEGNRKLCQIEVNGELGAVNLGTCIAINGNLGLRTKVAAKHLGRIKGFVLKSREEEGEWIPLEPGKPFPDLSRLEGSRLRYYSGQAGLLLD